MLWSAVSVLLVFMTAPLISADYARNLTCYPGIGPKHLINLDFDDFAAPFGLNSFHTFCQILSDFYSCDDYFAQNAPITPRCNVVFRYLNRGRRIFKNFCDPKGVYYKEYKKNEKCYGRVMPFFNWCIDLAENLQVSSFPIPKHWPSGYIFIENCKRGTQFFFCMVDRMRKICGKPDPALFYLAVQKESHLFDTHCYCPQLTDVLLAVNELAANLFEERRRNRQMENATLE